MAVTLFAGIASAATPITCGILQTNSISALGERDVYSYTAVAGEVITIRTLALTSGLDDFIELRDAGSNLLASAFSKIDRTLTNAGTYLIVVSDQGGNETGDYALALQRLVNPCNATALSCGQVLAGEIASAGELDSFTIASVGGEVFSLQLLTTNSLSLAFDLYTPEGRPLTTSDTDFVGTFTNAGTYTLIVRRSSGAALTGYYWLGVERVTNPCGAQTLSCGDVLTNAISEIRETDVYTVTGNAFVTLRLEGISASFTPTMRLYNSAGQLLQNSVTITSNLTSGSYTLLVSHSSGLNRTGSYRLAMQRVVAPCNATTITCGSSGLGSLDGAGELDAFTLSTTDDGPYAVEVFSTNSSVRFELYDPAGKVVPASGGTSYSGPLTNAGAHTLIVLATGGTRMGSYGVSFERTKNPCDGTVLPCGELLTNSIAQLGETDAWTFNLPAGGANILLKLESATTSFTPDMRLYDPNGVLVTSSSGTIVTNLATFGTYTLLVSYSSGPVRTGNYRLVFQHIVNPCGANALACGDLVAGALPQAGEIDAYALTASGGELVTIRLTTTNVAAFNPRFDLYDPSGRLLNAGSGSLFTGNLTNAGTYSLLVSYSSGSSRTGNYWLATEKISAPCNPILIACGSTTTGSIDAIGELDVFTFTAAAGEIAALKLTSMASGFAVTMDVFDSTGRALTLADAGTRFGGVLTNAGTYTVIVRYNAGSTRTGAYSLFFQNVTTPCNSSGVIACGSTASGLLLPGTVSTLSFAGAIGDEVLLRFQTSMTPSPSWEIYEPDGSIITPNDDTLKRTLTKNGNYFVVVFPPSGTPLITDYVISLNTVREPCAAVPLVCGATQTGVITEDGEVHAYTFNVVSNEVVLLRLGSLSEFFVPEFDLYDPDGELATGVGGYDDLTFPALKGGQNTVLVHWRAGANSGIGEYHLSFHRISAPCAPNVVTLGTTLNATFEEPKETHLYSFVSGPGAVTICANGNSLSINPSLQLFTSAGEFLAQGYSPFQVSLASNATYRLLAQNYNSDTGDYFIGINAGLIGCSNFDLTVPSVRLASPITGESVPRGANYAITWSSGDNIAVVRQEIWLSQDGGQSYQALNTNLAPQLENFVWAVPQGASAAGWLVRVVAIDAAGHSGMDETDGTFFAVDPAEVRTTTYGYDVLNQLVLFKNSSGQAQTFGYDPALNLTHSLQVGDPNTDTDGDGMNDLWEANHGLDPADATDGLADNDGDGMSNYAEYVACTDPSSASSVFAITDVFSDQAGTYLHFSSQPGRTYVAEWTTNLASLAWVPLPQVTAQFFQTTITNSAGLGASAQFYRVSVKPGAPCD
jgi:hypothetical protein